MASPLNGETDVEYRERLIRLYGDGLITLRECVLCGYREWISTNPSAAFRIFLETMRNNACPRCRAVEASKPLLMEWVAGVAAKLRRDIVEKFNADLEETTVFIRDWSDSLLALTESPEPKGKKNGSP